MDLTDRHMLQVIPFTPNTLIRTQYRHKVSNHPPTHRCDVNSSSDNQEITNTTEVTFLKDKVVPALN
jgi:hypothetical protein